MRERERVKERETTGADERQAAMGLYQKVMDERHRKRQKKMQSEKYLIRHRGALPGIEHELHPYA